MDSCSKFLKGGPYEHMIVNEKVKEQMSEASAIFKSRGGQTYLCPVGLESLKVRGDYGSENFDFVKISLKGCDLGPEECASEAEVG